MEWIVTARKIAAELLSGIRRAACLLTGAKRRCFQAEISIDNKAKVKVGPFSRGGSSRRACDRRAADHDMATCPLLVPV